MTKYTEEELDNMSTEELRTLQCGHLVRDYELSKHDGIVYITWICEEGCRATILVGEAPPPREAELERET